MIRSWIFIFLGLVLDRTSECDSGRFVHDCIRFDGEIFGNGILIGWRHDFLLSQNIIQEMPSFDLLVNSINNRFLDIMIPQFQFVTGDTHLIRPLVAHTCDFFNRKFILSSFWYSFRSSWHLIHERCLTPLPI
jgi:hypothetical protein